MERWIQQLTMLQGGIESYDALSLYVKSPKISGFLAERDVQHKVFYAPSPPCMKLPLTES